MRRRKIPAKSIAGRGALEGTDASLFLEQAPEGIAILHVDGTVLRVNSERGRGTTVSFELSLPQVLSEIPAHETSPLRTA